MSTPTKNADRDATAAILRLVARRWPSANGDEIGAIVRRAAKATGLSIPRSEYLRTLARRHDMIAAALRLGARAADGEDVDRLVDEDITTERRGADR